MPNQYDESNSSFNEPRVVSTYVDRMSGKVQHDQIPITSNARPDPNLEAKWQFNLFFGIPGRPSAFVADILLWISSIGAFITVCLLVIRYVHGMFGLSMIGFVALVMAIVSWLSLQYIPKHIVAYRLILFVVGITIALIGGW